MRWLEKGEFYVAHLKDYDTMTFNIIGPVYEGDNIDDRTYALRQKGRNLQIGVSPPQKDPRGFHPENFLFVPVSFKYDPSMRW